MNGSLSDGFISESVVAFGGAFGAFGTNGGGVAFVEVRFEPRLIGQALADGGLSVFQKLLKALAQELLVNHAILPPLRLRKSLSSHFGGIQAHCVGRAGITWPSTMGDAAWCSLPAR